MMSLDADFQNGLVKATPVGIIWDLLCERNPTHIEGLGGGAGTHQHIEHVQVHGDDVGDGADQVLLHAVQHQHGEVGAQAQHHLQDQEAGQGDLWGAHGVQSGLVTGNRFRKCRESTI